jgi:cell division protein FtsB
MAKARRRRQSGNLKATMVTGLALVALLLIAAYALLGPTGIIAWTDYKQALNERTIELAELEKKRDALRNRQRLLDRDNVDPDLAGELMRKELNVVAPDEIVVPLKNDE